MAGPVREANDATVRHGFQHVRPALALQDSQFAICSYLYALCRHFKLEVPEPPENPGAEWVIDQADAFFIDPDETKMNKDELFLAAVGGLANGETIGPDIGGNLYGGG